MEGPSFKSLFFRLYDRKIGDGTTTFSQTGIKKSDFTKLCVEDNYVLDDETIIRAAEAMKLFPEEVEALLNAAKRDRKDD